MTIGEFIDSYEEFPPTAWSEYVNVLINKGYFSEQSMQYLYHVQHTHLTKENLTPSKFVTPFQKLVEGVATCLKIEISPEWAEMRKHDGLKPLYRDTKIE